MNQNNTAPGDTGNGGESAGPAIPDQPAGPPEPLRRGGRILWRAVALRLAAGASLTDVAAEAGCHRSTLWRRLRTDAALRQSIAAEKQRIAHEAASRIGALRPLVAGIIEREVRAGNLRVVLWLADRLRLTGATGAGLPGAVDDPDDPETVALRAGMERLVDRARDALAAIDDGPAGAAPETSR